MLHSLITDLKFLLGAFSIKIRVKLVWIKEMEGKVNSRHCCRLTISKNSYLMKYECIVNSVLPPSFSLLPSFSSLLTFFLSLFLSEYHIFCDSRAGGRNIWKLLTSGHLEDKNFESHKMAYQPHISFPLQTKSDLPQ